MVRNVQMTLSQEIFFACLVSILKKGAISLHGNFPISATFKRTNFAWEHLKEMLGNI